METRNPVEGYFGNEFPAICNHYGVTVAKTSACIVSHTTNTAVTAYV